MKVDEKVKEAMKLARWFELENHGCSQSVVYALQKVLGPEDDYVFKAATPFAGGIARNCLICGAFIGGVMAIGWVFGRSLSDIKDPEGKRYKAYSIVDKFLDDFKKEFGGVMCHKVQERLYGRSFNLKKEYEAFEAAGAHTNKGCSKVTSWVAGKIVELLAEAEVKES